MNKSQLIDSFTGKSSCITIAIHTHPDGDAVGSGVALLSYLRECRGKDAVLVSPDKLPASLAFITDGTAPDAILNFEEDRREVACRISRSDLIFCLDCNSFSRTAGLEELLRDSGASKILIDHHLNPESESFDIVVSKTDISSASELLYWTLKQMPDIAEDVSRLPAASRRALLTGMTTDTNNFGNSVFPSTLSMASELIGAGVDRDEILCSLYNSYRENRVRLMGHLMGERMKITPEGVAYTILDSGTQRAYDFQEGETEGFVNIPLSISKVRMSIFLTEEEDRFRVSVRSKKGTSANMFATRHFNGGGHEQASGGRLVFGKDIPSADAVEEHVLNAIESFFKQ